MCCRRVAAAWLALGLLSSSAALAAPGDDEIAGSWVLAVSAQVDDEASNAFGAAFDWAFAARSWASFSLANTRSPRDRADVTARTLSAGIDHRFGRLGASVRVQQWGEPGEIESLDWQPSLYIRGERLTWSALYEQRDIDITLAATGPRGNVFERTAGLSATGVGMRVSLRFGEAGRFYALAKRYDYSRDLTVLPRIDRLNRLGASTLTLAGSFLDAEMSLGLEWSLGRKLLDVGYRRDRSAVDRSELETLDLGVLLPVAPRLDLEFDLGRSVSPTLESSTFAGVLILFYGG